jgi:hypothetical protein
MIEAIKAGRKTQTRRPMKAGDVQWWDHPEIPEYELKSKVYDGKGRIRWRVGHCYSICPGRGKLGIGFIEILAIWRQPVREISEADALAEGFENREAFLAAWKALYPKGNLEAHVWVLEFRLV